ncbi:MAG TPA: SPFH domain-containing protein [Opitutaceae bacterium]|jgi:regulator of protease activity HflC (stomatin/prohibitin superfamily)
MTSLILLGVLCGIALAGAVTLLFGVYTIGPTERGVLTTFGRAQRLKGTVAGDPDLGPLLTDEEKPRYDFPLIHVVRPGGPYFKWPWQRLYRVDMTIQTTDIIWDPDIQQDAIEAVTKDNLTIGLTGQIRWRPCERNLYGYLFGVARPRSHVMGYFISVLRDRIATFHSQGAEAAAVDGISINDLRKNLSSINQFMEASCKKTAARYGIELEAALITTIDPPADVDDALASINTTQNQVAAAVSQARADADQKLTMAEQAVQIAKNMADADAAPIIELGRTLSAMFEQGGQPALESYLRNAMLPLREKAAQTVISS